MRLSINFLNPISSFPTFPWFSMIFPTFSIFCPTFSIFSNFLPRLRGLSLKVSARHGTGLLKAMLKWLSPGELDQRLRWLVVKGNPWYERNWSYLHVDMLYNHICHIYICYTYVIYICYTYVIYICYIYVIYTYVIEVISHVCIYIYTYTIYVYIYTEWVTIWYVVMLPKCCSDSTWLNLNMIYTNWDIYIYIYIYIYVYRCIIYIYSMVYAIILLDSKTFLLEPYTIYVWNGYNCLSYITQCFKMFSQPLRGWEAHPSVNTSNHGDAGHQECG